MDEICTARLTFIFSFGIKNLLKKSGWKFPILLFTGGIKDLKIYADLALLSVEGDEHVGRVTHLHSAAIGYSSVIFGDINGEVEMINTWRVVWQNLEKDESLPKKLVTIQPLFKKYHKNVQKIMKIVLLRKYH